MFSSTDATVKQFPGAKEADVRKSINSRICELRHSDEAKVTIIIYILNWTFAMLQDVMLSLKFALLRFCTSNNLHCLKLYCEQSTWFPQDPLFLF